MLHFPVQVFVVTTYIRLSNIKAISPRRLLQLVCEGWEGQAFLVYYTIRELRSR